MSGDFDFLKGSIETIILNSLYSHDKYGYEIAKDIKERTANKYEIKQATLYSYLKRLEDDGLIHSYWGDSSNGGRRRYYKLTEAGKKQCQEYIAEWNYHKEVISNLVTESVDETDEVSQDEVTPIFGRKSAKKRQSKIDNTTADEQDEIARRLKALAEGKPIDEEEPDDEIDEIDVVDDEILDEGDEQEIDVVQDDLPSKETTSDTQPLYQESATVAPNDKSRFETNQDDSEEFMENFDALARDASARNSAESSTGENYQHVLLGVLSEQLDGVQDLAEEHTVAHTYYSENPQQLEEVADTLAKEGIRVRIYNHATAVYKPKILMPFAGVLCVTSWLTFAVALLYFGIFAICSMSTSNWLPFVVCAGITFVAPLSLSIFAIFNTTRKEKPTFDFRHVLFITLILCVAVALIIVVINAFNPRVELDNYITLCDRVFIPLGFVILPPCAVTFYNLIYKRYQ